MSLSLNPGREFIISLHTDDPSQDPSNDHEATYEGYSRRKIFVMEGDWDREGRRIHYPRAIEFPPATGGGEGQTITHICIRFDDNGPIWLDGKPSIALPVVPEQNTILVITSLSVDLGPE